MNGPIATHHQKLQARVCVVTSDVPAVTETFIRQHIEELAEPTVHVFGWPARIGGHTVLPLAQRVAHKVRRHLRGEPETVEQSRSYELVFRRSRAQVVLAEYGEVGADVLDACKACGVPLVVHFHGYDASQIDIIERRRKSYQEMFSYASAIVGVSTTMVSMLVALGAPRDRVHYNPYGVDLERFEGATPGSAPPRFLAVGRFVAKKAPDLTLRAFARVRAAFPAATLRMIGGGHLLQSSRQLAEELGVAPAVTFSGFECDETVRAAMREARCFVQHSIVAPNGDMEGTPVAVLEASASGLPIVATRHAGILDAVREDETGYLVDEGDVEGMAVHMLRLAREPGEASRLGSAGREWIRRFLDAQTRLAGLRRIVAEAIHPSGTR